MAELQIIEWLAKHDNNITQHSDAWHVARTTTIGGSSISTIMGLNPFETIASLVSGRCKMSSFDGSIMTEWGNIFEPLICSWVSIKYNTTIRADKFFISNGNLSYSPDGLCIIDGKVVLLEFKCPFMRIPGKTPPKYYVPQVKMGLEMIPITEYGLFVEAIYRKCAWVDLIADNTIYEVFDRQKSIGDIDTVLDYGFVGFYFADNVRNAVPNSILRDYLGQYGTYSVPGDIHDLSDITTQLFEKIIMCKGIKKFYSTTALQCDNGNIPVDMLGEVSKFEQCVTYGTDTGVTGQLLGVLPWKLISIKETIIDKTPEYLVPWMEKINDVTQCITECNDPDNKLKIPNIIEALLLKQGIGFY